MNFSNNVHSKIIITLQNLNNAVSELTQKMKLYISKLQNIAPEKKISLKVDETRMSWLIKWNSPKYFSEHFEIEIWSEKNLYTLRGDHAIDDLLKQVNETHFLYENKTENELADSVKEILQNIKDSISEITGVH